MIGIEGVKPWSGHASGRFHIDCLGVKTDSRFYKNIQPARPGWRQVSAPGLSDLLFEYTACVMACSVADRPFRALEIGGGWGVWAVRAAIVARRLGVPVRSTVIEMLPEQCQQIGRHFMTNGLDPRAHPVIQAAVSGDGKDAWIRGTDPLDPGARLVHDDWARRNAVVPPDGMAYGMTVACRDGTQIIRTPTKRLEQLIKRGTRFDFVHLRIGPGPHNLLDDPVLAAEHIGLLVIPSINATDLPLVEEKMRATAYIQVAGLEDGQVLHGARGETKLKNALRIYAGAAISAAQIVEMAAKFAELAV
jgi:hypothetical protein